MKQPRTKIARAIADRTLQGGLSKRYSQEIAAYLLSERRVNELDSLLRDVQTDWAEVGYVEVTASSAHPLTAAVKSEIKQQVKALYPKAKEIMVREVHDPELIGGVRLSLANYQLDLSIEATLNRFRQLTTTGKD